jgi:hypothetical protein
VKPASVASFSQRPHQIAWPGQIGENPSGFEEHEEFLVGLDRILDSVQTLIGRGPGSVMGP